MIKKFDISTMSMTSVLKKWITDRLPKLKDTIVIYPDLKTSHFVTSYSIHGEYQYLMLEVNEHTECFSASFESTWILPPTKISDMCQMIGLINQRLPFGALLCMDNGSQRFVVSKLAINVDASSFTPHQISSMVVAGASIFEDYHKPLSTVALTNSSVDAVWSKFLAEENKEDGEPAQGRTSGYELDELRGLISFGEVVPYERLLELGPDYRKTCTLLR